MTVYPRINFSNRRDCSLDARNQIRDLDGENMRVLPSRLINRSIFFAFAFGYLVAPAEAESFYKNPYGLFSTRPSEEKSLQTIDRFGPVGIGIELIQPAFTMRIKNIEEGSPAAETGLLKKGQIIESINGQKLADIDPRIQLGNILAAAEASDGSVTFAIKGKNEPITLSIPVLGAYSNTWPLNCPKSDKIVRRAADYLSQEATTKGLGDIGMLFLLSTKTWRSFVIGLVRRRPTRIHGILATVVFRSPNVTFALVMPKSLRISKHGSIVLPKHNTMTHGLVEDPLSPATDRVI